MRSSLIRTSAALAFIIYGSLVARRFPRPVATGLDPSWGLALSHAAHDRMVWGRDIIFTYGPLGHLLDGSGIKEFFLLTAFFQVLAALALFTTVAIRVLRDRRSPAQNAVLIVTSLLCAAGVIFTDDFYVLAFIAILAAPAIATSRRAILNAAVLGIVAGVMTLVKFTMGVDAVGTGLIVFAFGGALAGGTFAAAAALTSFVVFAVASASASIPAYIEYLRTSLQIALGYSSGMVISGPQWQTVLAAFVFGVVIVALATLGRSGRLPLSLALAFALFMLFKHGFVRQDGHVTIFFTGAAFIGALALFSLEDRTLRWPATVASIIATGCFIFSQYAIMNYDLLRALNPATVVESAREYLELGSQYRRYDEYVAKALQPDRLPMDIRNLIGDAPVDAIPYETTLIFANGLHWSPEPVFQTYSAYTDTLAMANASSLARGDKTFILFTYGTTDGRYPLADEPAAALYILCNYAPAQPDFIATEATKDIMLLRRRPASRCGAPVQIGESNNALDVPFSIPERTGALTVARLTLHYNLEGAIAKPLFRSTEAYLNVQYTGGSKVHFRIVPELLDEGILLAPVPRNPADMLTLLKGGALPAVANVSISGSSHRFARDFRVTFLSVPYH